MRCTQEMGLTSQATVWLTNNCARTERKECPTCHNVTGDELKREKYDRTFGMFEEEIPLYKYTSKDGKEVYEYVQACPWSSGPCIFLSLRWSNNPYACESMESIPDDAIKESLWAVEEIENA